MGRSFAGRLAAALALGLVTLQPAQAQKVLFHGSGVTATNGDDGAVLAHLESMFGAQNVTYMQAIQAAADGSSAVGFNAIVISSTTNSGDLLKYADAPIGVLNWESALTRDDRPGEYFLSTGGATIDSQTQINIENPLHPIAGGLGGTVTVFTTPHTMSFGNGTLGSGVDLVGTLASNPANYGIMAADVGAALLGDGSPGSPATAPGRRVMFFLQDAGFTDLTPDGLQLFNNALNYVLMGDPLPLFVGGQDTIGDVTLPLGAVEFGTTQEPTSVPGLTMDVYRNVNLGTQSAWINFLTGLPAPAASGTVPWINWDEVPDNAAAELDAPNSYADAQPILDAGLTDAGGTNFSTYSVRMTGEIRIPESQVRFKDGNDDYTYLAIDLDGNDQIESSEVLIDDNAWAPWNGADIADGSDASPIVVANFTGSLTGDAAWRKIEFRMAEGGGDDNGALFWDQNPGGFFNEFTTNSDFLGEPELVPQDRFRTFQEQLTSVTLTSSIEAVAVFDVLVEQIDWDRLKMPGNGGRLELDGAEFQINVLDPENLTNGFTIDLIRDENIGQITGMPTITFLNTDAADWDTSQFAINGQLTFGGVPQALIGDYNGNGMVEQADLDLVLLNWGQPGVPAAWVNDLPEGNIDQAELDGVLLNWGNMAALGGSFAGVPEPGAAALLLAAAGLALGWLRRRGRKSNVGAPMGL